MFSGRVLAFFGVVLLVVLAWASCFFRFDIHIVPNADGYCLAYRLDRWTGNVRLIEDDQWYPVVEGNPEDLKQSFDSRKDSSS